MNPCNNCFENNWKTKYIDGFVIATCNLCGFEVEFEKKKKGAKRKPIEISHARPIKDRPKLEDILGF